MVPMVFTFVSLLLTASPAVQSASAQATACKAERATTVCKAGDRMLRVIQKSQSPDGRYGVAWTTRAAKPQGAQYEEAPDGAVTVHGADVDNFLVRLPDGKLLAKLAGEHFSDKPNYLSSDHFSYWSPDGNYLVEVNNGRWSTRFADAYRIAKDDRVSGRFDLLPFCKTALLAHDKELRGSQKKYENNIVVKSVQADGTIELVCGMSIPRSDKDEQIFDVRLQLEPREGGMSARVLSIRRTKSWQ
jgi:hypothetical protein